MNNFAWGPLSLDAARGEPHVRLDIVPRHALAVGVRRAEAEVRVGVTLLGGPDEIVKRRPSLFLPHAVSE